MLMGVVEAQKEDRMVLARSLLTRLQSADAVSSGLPEDESSAASVRVTARGESASVTASLDALADADTAENTVSATVEAESDGVKVVTSGDATASGETASVSVDVDADIDTGGAVTVVATSAVAEAQAEAAEGGAASASADTEAEVTGPDLEISEKHEATETGGDTPTATSFTQLMAIRIEDLDLGRFDANLAADGLRAWWSDIDWSF
jgi:hypothetical protein